MKLKSQIWQIGACQISEYLHYLVKFSKILEGSFVITCRTRVITNLVIVFSLSSWCAADGLKHPPDTTPAPYAPVLPFEKNGAEGFFSNAFATIPSKNIHLFYVAFQVSYTLTVTTYAFLTGVSIGIVRVSYNVEIVRARHIVSYS